MFECRRNVADTKPYILQRVSLVPVGGAGKTATGRGPPEGKVAERRSTRKGTAEEEVSKRAKQGRKEQEAKGRA